MKLAERRERAATVLVVGVGGIGAPCAWALADADVARLLLVDPDRVEPSNLPRQVLFGPADVGRPKAEVAAHRLARPGLEVVPVVGRLDATTGAALVAAADVVVDGTDGAATKDLVNAFAVRAGRPFVHAAALGSEGRVLDVAPGGRPCLACLFGLATDRETGDTCERYGVFPGITGAVGALAALAALEFLANPARPSRGLRVLDRGASRAVTLGAPADPRCPVCGDGVAPEGARSVPAEPTADAASACAPPDVLDLRDESCPMNLLRARRAAERLAPGESLAVWLGSEGRDSVPEGLEALGYAIGAREARGAVLTLRVGKAGRAREGGAPSPALDSEAWLRRYARQIVLPEVGEAGQRRWNAARVRVVGTGDAWLACALHLAAAGVGTVEVADTQGAPAGANLRWPFAAARDVSRAEALAAGLRSHLASDVRAVSTPRAAPGNLAVHVDGEAEPSVVGVALAGPAARAEGALAADAAMRRLLGLPGNTGDVVVRPDGTLAGPDTA